jgi:AcrR family transcriptional regulator
MILVMRIDGEATRERILAAAGREFAEFGLAGARVDRIAAAANASKERLYAYFGDKRGLFGAVLEAHMAELTQSMPLTADDLPGFVGRIFDFATEHPEHFRMMDWARLGGDFDLVPALPASVLSRDYEAITAAQARGIVDPEWDPSVLVPLLFALASTSAGAAVLVGRPDASAEERSARRAAAVRAASKLVTP